MMFSKAKASGVAIIGTTQVYIVNVVEEKTKLAKVVGLELWMNKWFVSNSISIDEKVI